MKNILLDPIVSSIVIPVIFILLSGVAQKLIEAQPYRPEHFNIGMDLAWTSLSLSMAILLDGMRYWLGIVSTQTFSGDVYPWVAGTLVVGFGMALALMSAIQTYTTERADAGGSIADMDWRRMLAFNLTGAIPLAMNLYLMTQ